MKKYQGMFIGTIILFGTIGLFRRYILISSSVLAMTRGFLGALFLLGIVFLGGKKLNLESIQKNSKLLILSGISIGIDWILIFEAFRYTSLAVATLCYYMAPIIMVILSCIFLKEKITLAKGACILLAMLGMVFVSGILQGGLGLELKGIIYALGAALLYGIAILFNKMMTQIDAMEKTIVQLLAAGSVTLIYSIVAGDMQQVEMKPFSVMMLLVVCFIHTGMGYWIYFQSMIHLDTQRVAMYSFLDPVVAILLSIFVLQEPVSLGVGIGMVLILGSTLVNEWIGKEKVIDNKLQN